MVRWMSLTRDFKGTKYCAVTFESGGATRRASIPGVMDFSVEGVRAGRRRSVMRLVNTGHPVNATLAVARGTGNPYTDHGMIWAAAGKNGHYAPFSWTWPYPKPTPRGSKYNRCDRRDIRNGLLAPSRSRRAPL